MSLQLDNDGTKPSGLVCNTYGHNVDGNVVHVGDYEIDLEDLLVLTLYVLTNTDLAPGDPRCTFLDQVGALQQIPGHQPGAHRLG